MRSYLILLYILELRPILPAVTPLALLASWLAFPAVTPQHSYDVPPTNGKAPRAPLASVAAGLSREVSFHATRRNVKNMNPKNTKKSPIHENADANITCNFRDGDISHLGVAYLTHVYIGRYITTSIILRYFLYVHCRSAPSLDTVTHAFIDLAKTKVKVSTSPYA